MTPDPTRPHADYGELRLSSRLPPLARDAELTPRIGVARIGNAKRSGICFSNSLKGLLSRKASSHGAEGSGAARRRSRWG